MATFLLLGKSSLDTIQGVGSETSQQVFELIEQFGGKVESAYVTLGEYDVAMVLSLPGIEDAMKVSIALAKQTAVSFTTLPAVTIEEFGKMMD